MWHGIRPIAVGALAATAAVWIGCEDGGGSSSDSASAVNLGIADRAWSPGHSDVGWCGEASIQMAMGYYGKEVSQEAINAAAGSPSDITEVTMDTALRNLGVSYSSWNESNGDVQAFMDWIVDRLRSRQPVICGTKYYPDETPEWFVDHIVVATGFHADGLLLNTQPNADGQVWVSYAQLASMNTGIAFLNRHGRLFGRAITGVR